MIDVTGTKSELKALPLPLVVGTNTSVLIAGTSPLAAPRRLPATSLAIKDTYVDQKHWHKMEQMLLQVTQGNLPMIFKPTVNLYTKETDNSSNPTVPQGGRHFLIFKKYNNYVLNKNIFSRKICHLLFAPLIVILFKLKLISRVHCNNIIMYHL